ncbi:unnamed protein product [Paramecium sonneborni]|uniref:Uncharacterized protein n=1 Tax=Paramecium sonneborni TaxID=65129 RepID=A0A8S1P9M0_9CILI|nr:unnamed protein product [Paramecium sonneborni]
MYIILSFRRDYTKCLCNIKFINGNSSSQAVYGGYGNGYTVCFSPDENTLVVVIILYVYGMLNQDNKQKQQTNVMIYQLNLKLLYLLIMSFQKESTSLQSYEYY